MRIPKSFKLMGRTITTKYDDTLRQERDWCGSADYTKDEIKLIPISSSYQASDAKIQQTFCHELAHHLLYHAGGAINHELKRGGYIHQNEEFTDLLGSLIHQALTTMEYEETNTTATI